MATKTKRPQPQPQVHRGDELYEFALKYVNHRRVRKLRLAPLEELSKGLPGVPGEDPIARALGEGTVIGRDGFSRLPMPEGGLGTCASPIDLGRFLDAFDDGAYPALIASS